MGLLSRRAPASPTSAWSGGLLLSVTPSPTRARERLWSGALWRSSLRLLVMAAPIRLLAERSRVFLDYGQGEDHERIILDHVDACEYVVASPTFDIFVKQLDATNPDIEGIRYEVVPGQLPLGLDPNRVFGFRALTPVELDTLVGEGKLLGRSERLARGLGVAAGLGAAPIPAAAAVVPIAAPAPPGRALCAPKLGQVGSLRRVARLRLGPLALEEGGAGAPPAGGGGTGPGGPAGCRLPPPG